MLILLYVQYPWPHTARGASRQDGQLQHHVHYHALLWGGNAWSLASKQRQCCHYHVHRNIWCFLRSIIALAPMLVAQISKIQQIGIRSGALFSAVSMAALTGSPLAGALLNTDQGRFRYLQIFAGTMMLAAAGIVLISRAFALGFTVTKV